MEHPSGLAVDEHVPVRDPRPADAPAAPIVVLVHGSLDRGASFGRVRRRLPDLHTVVYDRRGYQGSRWAVPLATTLDSHVDDLLTVVAGRRAVVVGHSYGGTIALAAALHHDPPSTIASVAAYEPPLPWLDLWSPRAVTARDGHGTLGDDPAVAAERFFRRVMGDQAWDRLPERGRVERRADGPALVAEIDALRLDEPPFDVGALRIPAVFGRGERSRRHHRDGVAWLVEHAPDAELVEIPGATHGAHLSHPDAFARFVRRAVERAG